MISKAAAVGFLLLGLLLISLLGLLTGPIPQPQSYHHFADQRSWWGVANTWNVLSNIAFILVGIWGCFLLLIPNKIVFEDKRERWPWLGVACGLILTSLGSAFYHLDPDNTRLVWDRLPMTIVFTSYTAALISERINVAYGLWLWPLMLIIGFYSVEFWYWSELQGEGDLRLYLGVQLFAILTTFIMLTVPSPYNSTGYLFGIIIFFALARAAEEYDRQIFAISDKTISGHTLKHLLAAFTVFLMFWMLKKRKTIRINR